MKSFKLLLFVTLLSVLSACNPQVADQRFNPSLEPTLDRDTRLERIEVQLSQVCQGTSIPEAAGYGASAGIHPLAIFRDHFDPVEWNQVDDWNLQIPLSLLPNSVEKAELVLCTTGLLEESQIGDPCDYADAPSITRYQHNLTVRLLDAQTGELIVQATIPGPSPRGCKTSEPFSLERLDGEPVDLPRVLAWLFPYLYGEPPIQFLGHGEGIRSIAFNNGGNLITVGADGSLMVWDDLDKFSQGTSIENLMDYGEVLAADISAEGEVAALFLAGRVLIINPETSEVLEEILSEDTAPNGQLNASGQILGVTTRDPEAIVAIMDWQNDVLLMRLASDDYYQLSPDGDSIAIWQYAGTTVSIMDLRTGERDLLIESPFRVTSVIYNTKGNEIAIGSEKGTLQVWDLNEKNIAYQFDNIAGQNDVGALNWVNPLAFSYNDEHILVSGSDHVVVLDLALGKQVAALADIGYGLIAGAFSPDGKHALFANDNAFFIWDWEINQVKYFASMALPMGFDRRAAVTGISVSPDGLDIVASLSNGNFLALDAQSLRQRIIPIFAKQWLNPIRLSAFSLDQGSMIVTQYKDNSVSFVELSSGDEFEVDWSAELSTEIEKFEFTENRDRLAVLFADGRVQVFDVASGNSLDEIDSPVEGGRFTALEFMPDNKSLLLGTNISGLEVWEPGSASSNIQFDTEGSGEVGQIMVDPGGKFAVVSFYCCETDSLVQVYGIDTGSLLYTLPTGQSAAFISGFSLSPDGELLATWLGNDWVVALWDMNTGRRVGEIGNPVGSISSAAFSPDSDQLIIGYLNGKLESWEISDWLSLNAEE